MSLQRILVLSSSLALLSGLQTAHASQGGPPFYPTTVTPIISAGEDAGDQEGMGSTKSGSGAGSVSQTLQSSPVVTSTGVAAVEYQPAPYAYAQASSSAGTTGYFGGRSYLEYPVEIDASNAIAAAEISALIAQGPIGTVTANYAAGTSGDGQVTLQFGTGTFQGMEGTFYTGGGAGSFYQLTCGFGIAACTSGTWSAPISFKSAATLAQQGNPDEFLGGIQLAAYAYAGYSCASQGIYFSAGGCNGAYEASGQSTGYVDPKIVLNLPGVDPSSYTLVVGNGQVANAFGNGPAAVPEPAVWVMMLIGFGLVGAAQRRRARPLGSRLTA